MRYKFLLSGILLLVTAAVPDQPVPVAQPSPVFSLHIKRTVQPFWELNKKKELVTDTTSLKQTSWYADAIRNIEESEYEIKYQELTKNYVSSNRKNNLRSFFSSNIFTLQPRNDSIDKWMLQLTTLGVYSGKKLIYRPSGTPVTTLNKKDIRFNQDENFITEYINTKEGVRQNFIINKEPIDKPQTINLKLQTNNGWFVNKVDDKEIHFAKAIKTGYDKKITYNGLKAWDADHKELSVSFSVTQNTISIDVNTVSAVYPITIDPLSSTASAQLESNQTNAFMGCAVASAGDVNGDGYSDVIVGAYTYHNPAPPFETGAAFVFHGSATGVSSIVQAYLKCDETTQSDFGIAVATAGDVNNDGYSDVIVGADNYTHGQSQEGGAFVFLGSASGINTTIQAQLEMNQSLTAMGRSVASAGDVNADGYSDVIVGALAFDNGQSDEGAAFVYHGSPSGIVPVVQTQLEGNIASLDFGNSVASAGDVNGDGYSDVIIGVWAFSNGQSWEGAAFVFHGSSAGITTTIQTTLESNQVFAFLGQSVSSAGDVNGDGYSDVIVGSMYFDNGNTDEGVAFVYHGSASGITTTIRAQLEINQDDARFGESVSCAGDVNGDGYSDVVVGAFLYDNGLSNEGGAFVYHGSSTGINTTIQTQLECNQLNAQFGSSVCAAGDVNGDGYSDVIIGAPYYDNGNTDEGAAFVYHGSADGLSASPINTPDDADQSFARFGISVASAGDVNGDGYSDVIIGADNYDDGANTDEGRAFVYHGSATGLSATPNSILDAANQAFAWFGRSVSSAGDVNGDGYSDVIVGASRYDDGANTDEGRAFVYHGSITGLSASPNSTPDDADQSVANFGESVASAGDVNGDGYSDVIIGAFNYNDGASLGEGRAFVYYGSATGLPALPNNTPDDADQSNVFFGYSVASAGDVNGDGYSDVIIGAYNYDDGANTNEGRVFVYHGSATGLSASPNSIPDDANQANAEFGRSVSSAGDVNGDGYSDVIIGAHLYDDGVNTDEGRAFVYYGSAAGLSASPNSTPDDANQADAGFGRSVSSAGDVNGDGYSDVIIGAWLYDDGGNFNEGVAFIYYGSVAGLSASPNNTPDDADQSTAIFGTSVASAGDINGDGYSDVVIGASGYFDGGNSSEGRAFVYYGNNNGGLRNNLRLYNTDLITPIQQSNAAVPNLFGAGLFVKSPFGRTKGKLVWEIKKQGIPFSGNPITNSTAYYDKQTSLTDLGIAGIELKNNIQKTGLQNKVRVRVEYDKVTAITGQVYGPWRYPAGYTMGAYGMNSVPLPIKLVSFNGRYINDDNAELNWITENEINMQSYFVERSEDGISFITVGELAAKGMGSNRADYTLTDKNVKHNLLYYRLRLKEKNGDISYTKTITLSRSKIISSFIAPNPVHRGSDAFLILQSANGNTPVTINIYNGGGQLVLTVNSILQKGRNDMRLSTGRMINGIYTVIVLGEGIKENYRLLVQER